MRADVLFWVQHLLGIGHLTRAATLVRAMRRHGLEVVLVSGGEPVPGLDIGGARLVQLPPVRADDLYFKQLVDQRGGEIDEDFRKLRRERLLALFDETSPALLLFEMYPFGRRQMRFEVTPLIERARARNGRPQIWCSVRDILVEPGKPGRLDEMLDVLEHSFDRVMVHGDPQLIPFDVTFPRACEIAHQLVYTGYIVDERAGGEADKGKEDIDILVSTGGGRVSGRLLDAVLEASARRELAARRWHVLIGAGLPEPDFERYARKARPGLVIERARPDFVALLARARLSISQGGYNTVMEVLGARTPAIVVPYSGGLETEQTLRCRLLAERGLLTSLAEEGVDGEQLARAVETAPEALPADAVLPGSDGAERAARLIREAVKAHPVP